MTAQQRLPSLGLEPGFCLHPEQLTARDGLQPTLETWGTRSLGGTHPQLQGSAHPPADPTHLSPRPLTAANSCRVTKSASRGREPGLAGQMRLGYSSGLELAVTPRLWDSASPGEMRAEPRLEGFFQPRESGIPEAKGWKERQAMMSQYGSVA